MAAAPPASSRALPVNDNYFLRLGDVLGGYATTGSSQNVFGTRCSDSVSAETVSMVKEHFIEAFGEPDFVLGKGGSGGAMAQQMIGNNFPGLLDGLQISNSFTDNAFPGNQLMDCRLIDEFLASPEAAGWTTEAEAVGQGPRPRDRLRRRLRSLRPQLLRSGRSLPARTRPGHRLRPEHQPGRHPLPGL